MANRERLDQTEAVDPRLIRAVELFNAREFFACHDVLEEIWGERLGEDRAFYQGLIHAAVALFHFQEGNLGGARKMQASAMRYLAPYAPTCAGLDVAGLLAEFSTCFADLAALRDPAATHVQLRPALIPRLRFVALEGTSDPRDYPPAGS